ncbi:MAG TPA: hypothetical protein VHC97_27630 [Thermoanaerobaculia bacterium]|jgi:hypothetical protein|nr:hypothetical protein [Thermoanaerobaculia bacterium]
MKRSTILSTLLIAFLAAVAAHAGTVYVPSPGPGTLGGSNYEVQISVTNTAATARDVRQVLLAPDTDGTTRTGTPSTVTVQPGRTVVVKPGASFRGLVELSGGGELRYAARLVGTGPGRLGVTLPVITSDNLLRANQPAALQGLLSGAGRNTDITLVNASQAASQCTVTLTRADGTVIGSPVVPLKPLSVRTFPNVLTDPGTEIRATATCTREFFLFALLTDAATGELSYVGPSGSGESLLRVPGEGPVCPPTAACFDVKGVVHAPTTAVNAVKRVIFTPVPGTYTKIHMTLDVTMGDWWATNPAALHEIFWLVKDRNFNMFGYAALRGPDQNMALLRHGIGLTHPQKIKIVQPFTPVPGRTYHFDYIYDTKTSFLELAISEGGAVVSRLTGQPNVNEFSFKAGENIVIDMGFPGTAPDEAPTFGWVYRDLHLELSK